ncbi:MAG: tRNA pseudouridine(54/55) synthase Pus10, partial [Candidatus Methanomethylophilaceae archaeon]
MEDWIVNDVDKAKAVAEYGLCDRCLGRMFGKLGTGMTNDVRGTFIRKALEEEGYDIPAPDACPLCEGIFDLLGRFAETVADKVNDVESENFLVGSRVDPEIMKREKDIRERFELENAESIKTELNREIGKLALPMINRPVEFKNPQIVACIDTRFADVELDIAPIFIYGRYNKLSREIPQTIWPCRVCHGKGCSRCHDTGKMYQTSVQEILGDIALEMSGGKEHFFHGMGREDIDALMLGEGRPFVLEISNPRTRDIDLDYLEAKANQSELAQYHNLR